MTNNPFLEYAPNVFMNTIVPVEMAAADWNLFMSWAMRLDDDDVLGVSFILKQIGDQVAKAIYTPASIKAADANFAQMKEDDDHARTPHVLFMPGMMPPRCESCQRLAGMPTAPCPDCPDFRS